VVCSESTSYQASNYEGSAGKGVRVFSLLHICLKRKNVGTMKKVLSFIVVFVYDSKSTEENITYPFFK
jgi:hypothetical protein